MYWTIKNTGVFTKDDNKHTGESVRSFQKFMYMIQTCLDGTFFFGIGGRRWIVVQKRSKALLLEIDVWICQDGSEPCSFPKSLYRSSHGVKLTQMAIDFSFFIKFSKKTLLPNLKNTLRFHNHTYTLSHLSDKIMWFFYMYETWKQNNVFLYINTSSNLFSKSTKYI